MSCYAVASRVRFEFGGVFAVPTQPIFVAMWFLVPPRILPVVICLSLVLAELPDFVRRRTPLDHLALYVISSWFSVGPALVIFLWAAHAPRWQSVPVYAAALGAQFLFDYVSQYLMVRPVFGLSPMAQLRSVLPAFAVDAMLAPLGLLVAFTAYGRPWTLLLVLPVLLLFSTFARERQQRIDNALELSSAYRGTAMLLGDVIEADDEYTGTHSRDVVDLVVAVADVLELSPRDRQRAEFAALLHDVGKVKIPSEIINKAGALDDAEWELMKTHTIIGEQLLDGSARTVLDTVRRLGFLQIDPISTVAPPQQLVLWSRLGAHDPGELDRLLWEERKLVEWHAYIWPVEDLPLLRARMRRRKHG